MAACDRSISAIAGVFDDQMNLARTDQHRVLTLISRFNPSRVAAKIIKERRWQIALLGPDYELFPRQDDMWKMQMCIHSIQIARVETVGKCFHATNCTRNHQSVIIGAGRGLEERIGVCHC